MIAVRSLSARQALFQFPEFTLPDIETIYVLRPTQQPTRLHMQRRDEFGVMGRHFDSMAEALQDREFVRETFGRYVSEDVAKLLLDQRIHTELAGEERVVTVLISDIRGYSTISERLPPVQVVDMLNRYLSAMNEVIDEHKGCVIEFLGDAILAVFGAPHYLPDHSERAVRCALSMRVFGIDRGSSSGAVADRTQSA